MQMLGHLYKNFYFIYKFSLFVWVGRCSRMGIQGPMQWWAVPWYSLQAVRVFVSLYVARRSVSSGYSSRTISPYTAVGRQVDRSQTGALM